MCSKCDIGLTRLLMSLSLAGGGVGSCFGGSSVTGDGDINFKGLRRTWEKNCGPREDDSGVESRSKSINGAADVSILGAVGPLPLRPCPWTSCVGLVMGGLMLCFHGLLFSSRGPGSSSSPLALGPGELFLYGACSPSILRLGGGWGGDVLVVVAPGDIVAAVTSKLPLPFILLVCGGDRLCILLGTGDDTDLTCVGPCLGTLVFLGGGPGGGGGMLPRLRESPRTAPGGMGPRGTELSLGGGPGGGGGILVSDSALVDAGGCCCARSRGEMECDLRPFPMPICITAAALLVLCVLRAGVVGIGEVSRLIGGGPGGGGGIPLGPRELERGDTIGLGGTAASGDGYEACCRPDGV